MAGDFTCSDDKSLDAIIREAAEAHCLAINKLVDPEIWKAIEPHLRPAVSRALRNFFKLEQEVNEADSARKLRAVRRELNKATARMQAMLADYIRLARLYMAERKAITVAKRVARRASWVRQRIISRDLNELLADMDRPGNLPLDRQRNDPLGPVDDLLLRSERKATYGAVWGAARQYIVWSWRHLRGLATIYTVEISLSVIGLGLGVSAFLGAIQKMWFAIGLIVAFIYRLLHHFWLGELIGAFFLKRRKAWLLISIRDFFNSAIRTYSFLAIAYVKLFGEYPKRTDN
jgi:hypothetical protein